MSNLCLHVQLICWRADLICRIDKLVIVAKHEIITIFAPRQTFCILYMAAVLFSLCYFTFVINDGGMEYLIFENI